MSNPTTGATVRTFSTPEPIRMVLEVPSGRVELTTDAVDETSVRVAPMDASDESDRQAADVTEIVRNGREVRVDVPQRGRLSARHGAIKAVVALPENSELQAKLASADLQANGVFGHASIVVASGDVRLETVQHLDVKGASGKVMVGRAAGDLNASTASGAIRVDAADRSADVKTASGDIEIGRVGGELGARTASGDLTVDALHHSANTRTASGDVVFGVPAGTAAWLELKTLSGDVNNRLSEADSPGQGENRIRINATSTSGDITVRRSK